jgi:RNA-binding protein Musashi
VSFALPLVLPALLPSCKQNLLQGEAAPAAARTTRIFVARIPQSVTDTQFRSYFEKYGRLQDAYMPRDHSRQMYRGIGFVTFASPESVEKVMACKHWCVPAGWFD